MTHRYDDGKVVKEGDILTHKKWMNNRGKPATMEVVRLNYFGSSIPGKITVVLREDCMWGFHTSTTQSMPRRNGGMAHVSMDEVRYSGHAVEGESVFDPAPKRRRSWED